MSQEHLHAFVSSIRARAEQESDAILSESQRYCKEQLDIQRRELSAQRSRVLRNAREEAQREAGQAISEAIRESACAVSEKQLAIRDDVFEKVAQRLQAFVLSVEYLPFLKGLAKQICASMPQGIRCVRISPRDLSCREELAACFPEGTAIEADDSIRIGGLCAISSDGCKQIDASLGAMLDDQKRRFAETGGMDVS